jgi:nucleotide-binding universal stress UspA family protein
MYRNILVPLDGSELAECSLPHAKAIAKGCKAFELILFRAIEPLSGQAISAMMEAGNDFILKVEYENKKEAEDYVAKMASTLKAEGFPTRGVTINGRASDKIMDYSQKNNIDLIVMSTHGRSGISRFYFGSVAEKVSRHSPIPVLLISPSGCRVVPDGFQNG